MMPTDPKQAVPQDVYNRDYYLHCRHGSNEFIESGGKTLSPIHERILTMARPEPGRDILDVGCGCGELVIQAVLRGASAIGLDYAEAAHSLAQEAARKMGVNAEFILGDVSALPDRKFDAIILADVVEHLYQDQLDRLYSDLHGRLKPDGSLIIHTWPNRWHTEGTYPMARFFLGLAGIKKPKSPRKPHDEIMHVNEQSIFSLRRDLARAGYVSTIWVEHPMPEKASRVYRFAHAAPVIRNFFADHLFATAKPALP